MEEILKSNYVIELTDRIEEMFENVPDKRKKKEYLEWRQSINLVIERVNNISKIKMYPLQ